jgi:hypothetical protein
MRREEIRAGDVVLEQGLSIRVTTPNGIHLTDRCKTLNHKLSEIWNGEIRGRCMVEIVALTHASGKKCSRILQRELDWRVIRARQKMARRRNSINTGFGSVDDAAIGAEIEVERADAFDATFYAALSARLPFIRLRAIRPRCKACSFVAAWCSSRVRCVACARSASRVA